MWRSLTFFRGIFLFWATLTIMRGIAFGQFRSNKSSVLLEATLTNAAGDPVLDTSDQQLTVYENGQPQRIESITRDQGPISLGIVVDQSTACPLIREQIRSSALTLIEGLTEADDLFLTGSTANALESVPSTENMHIVPDFLDQHPWNVNPNKEHYLQSTLNKFRERSTSKKHVFVYITSDEEAVEKAKAIRSILPDLPSVNVLVYVIAIRQHRPRSGEKAWELILNRFTKDSGGQAYFPEAQFGTVDQSAKAILRVIRNQFAILYTPQGPLDGTYRLVEVHVENPRVILVRTRKGYYASATPL
jgi:VWFA-related protein